MELKNKRVFVFDWDGTLFDSMKIKRDNFVFSIMKSYPNIFQNELDIRNTYIELSGIPRYKLFFELSARLNLNPTNKIYDVFNDLFNKLNTSNLKNAKMFSDAEKIIQLSYKAKKEIFISSSVPEDELLDIINSTLNEEQLNAIKYIMGTTINHQKGITHIKDICDIAGCEKSEIQFFGDDYEDYKLSQQAKVDCIILDRESRHIELNIPKINSFYDIQDEIHV